MGEQFYSVTTLTDYVKRRLEGDTALIDIWVRGEISNLTHHSSGHVYFSLKDAESQLRCAMFRRDASKLQMRPEHGMQVVVYGSISVYKPYGSYQLIVHDMQPAGMGDLHLRYLQLKERLKKEGLFDAMHKRSLPRFPLTVGVVTSESGAAIQDLVYNLSRRYPPARILFAPAQVQGERAAPDLVRAIEMLDRRGDVDVIVVGRGGGSLEDLWAFNEEPVARAVFEAESPVVSAVGHESDFTITDLVADVRAPTPSTAAELVVPDAEEMHSYIDRLHEQLVSATRRVIQRKRESLVNLVQRRVLSHPTDFLAGYLQRLDELDHRATRSVQHRLELRGRELEALAGRLSSLDPYAVMRRGYSVLLKDDAIVKKAEDLSTGDDVRVLLSQGKVDSRVTEVYYDVREESE